MRIWEILREASETSVRVFHGSPYDNIVSFRTNNIRNRTGTPGTLSFTTSVETAKIYGPHIYEVEARGTFGDYLEPEDVEANFAWRWPSRKRSLIARVKPAELDIVLARAATSDRKEIADGHYAMWENIGLWRAMGWDGAWCHESGSRNLIVGNTADLRLIAQPVDRLRT